MSIPNIDALSSVELFGSGDIDVHLKFTSEAVLDRWDELMVDVNAVLDIVGTAGNPASDQITATQHTNFVNAINGLIDLAKNGHTWTIDDPNSTTNPPATIEVTDYLTVEMVRDFDNLLRTINSADSTAQIDPNGAVIPFAALQSWRDFAEITPIIKDLVKHMNNARSVGGAYLADEGVRLDGVVDELGRLKVGSLQSMVELLYVKTGTELMADNLDNLESALTANKSAIEALTSLQSYHNEITAFSKGQIPLELGDIDRTESATARDNYSTPTSPASTFFDSISPELAPGMSSLYEVLQTYQTQAVQTGLTLETNISSLLGALNALVQSASTPTITVNWDLARTNIVKRIKSYNESVIAYNSQAEKLNAQLQPYVDLLVVSPATSITIPVGSSQITIPLQVEKLPLPPFSTEEIPGQISALLPEQFQTNQRSSLDDVLDFVADKIFPFLTDLTNLNGSPVQVETGSVNGPRATTSTTLDFNAGTLPGPPALTLTNIQNMTMDLIVFDTVNNSTVSATYKYDSGNMRFENVDGPDIGDIFIGTGSPLLFQFEVDEPQYTFDIGIYTISLPPETLTEFPIYLFNNNLSGGLESTDNISVDQLATAIYSQDKVINGEPAAGVGPIASINLAKNIKAQVELINNQINMLAQDPNQANNPNALLARLRTVVADLNNAGLASIPNVQDFANFSDADKKKAIEDITKFTKAWIIDGLTDLESTNSSFAGKIQENLGFAISAGQSLNDQQKEETRRFLFLFEEFYKSASAILTKVTQILEKMAQNINR